PVVHGLERLSVGAVEAMAAVAADADQAHPAQDAEVFRDRRLIEADGHHDLANLVLVCGQKGQNLAAAGLGHGVEGIGGGSGSCHDRNNTFSYGNMSREIFAGAIWADWGISGAGGAIGYSFRQ